jgi:2,4-dienoyl-CoA reductase-like NADH-dependent reductase (Old Yellow Enzyme family)
MERMLFTPLAIRGVTLRNRIVVSPMLTYSATNGHANDWHLAHLTQFAAGGAGLVFMESTKIDPAGWLQSRGVPVPQGQGG